MQQRTIVLVFLARYSFPFVAALSLPSSYSAPNDPPGFKAIVEFGATPLNPVGVYTNAVEAMARFSSEGEWETTVIGNAGVVDPILGIGIGVQTVAPPGSAHPLKLSYVLLGVYQGVLAMAERNEYHELTIRLQFNGETKGVLRITKTFSPPSGSDSISNYSVGALADNYNVTSISADSGIVVDPDPRFRGLTIDWRFDGRKMFASDIFTAILDAMISTATENARAHRSHIYGISFSGNCVINIQDGTNLYPHTSVLTNEVIREGLLLISRAVLIVKRKFMEMEFTIARAGDEIAKGFFFRMNDAGPSAIALTAGRR